MMDPKGIVGACECAKKKPLTNLEAIAVLIEAARSHMYDDEAAPAYCEAVAFLAIEVGKKEAAIALVTNNEKGAETNG